MLHVRMDSAENADALGLYVYNIVVVSASCHYCCWLSFSEHVGFYKGRQLLPHFTHSVTADLSYWQLVCWQVRVMLRNCPWWHSSLCQWNKMYEMHHYSFSSRFRKCHVFSVYFMSKVWCQIVVLFFFARSVLCELASTCHLAKLFLNCYVTYWLEQVVLHNFFQVILLSCFFVKMLKLWSKSLCKTVPFDTRLITVKAFYFHILNMQQIWKTFRVRFHVTKGLQTIAEDVYEACSGSDKGSSSDT